MCIRDRNLSIDPHLPLFCLSELFVLTVGAAQTKRIKCRYLNVPFVANSTPKAVNVLQDVVY